MAASVPVHVRMPQIEPTLRIQAINGSARPGLCSRPLALHPLAPAPVHWCGPFRRFIRVCHGWIFAQVLLRTRATCRSKNWIACADCLVGNMCWTPSGSRRRPLDPCRQCACSSSSSDCGPSQKRSELPNAAARRTAVSAVMPRLPGTIALMRGRRDAGGACQCVLADARRLEKLLKQNVARVDIG